MPKIDPKQFRLLKRSPAGKISAKEITTDAIQVESGYAYTVIEVGSGKLPAKLAAKRAGQDLNIFVEGQPVIRLEGFYAPVNGNTAFDGSGELFAPVAGNYESGYALLTGDPLVASDKVIVGKAVAATEEGSSWMLWGGVIGLGVIGAAAAGGAGASSGSGGNNGGSNGGNTGGNNGGNSGGNNGGNTGGGGSTPLPLPLVSSRAGITGDEGLANADVQIRYDANADGRIDVTEATSTLAATLKANPASSSTPGQFSLPVTIHPQSFHPSVGALQFTSTGGTAKLMSGAIPVSGPVQYMAYLTHPVVESTTNFQVVLSPLTTLASHLFRTELTLGKPSGFNLDRMYAENMGFVADALGVSMPADALMSIAPTRGIPQRLVAERQVNALLDALVSLSSGKSDASAPVASANASADIGYRLANYLVQHGSLVMIDATELRAALSSVLPASVAINGELAATLERLMRAYALGADGDAAIAQAAMKVLPQLSVTMAALKTAMSNGSLDDATTQANLRASLLRLSSDLDSALKSATPTTYARVIVNADGAFIDRNLDGQLNDEDRVNGSLVTADFSAGKNADPVLNRVVITFQNTPGGGSVPLPTTLNGNDRVSVNLDSVNFLNPDRVQQLDLQWSALDTSADARFLKTLQGSSLKPDLNLIARGPGSTARLTMGKPGNPSEGVVANLGAIAIVAVGNQNGFLQSTAELLIELKGAITGTARAQAAGRHSSAGLTVDAPAGLETSDLMAVSTGHSGSANINVHQSAADKTLKVGALSATSHSADSQTHITLNGDDGKIMLGSQVSALASGSGGSAIIEISSGKGAIGPATAGAYSSISAIATGARFGTGIDATGSNARVTITSLSGAIDVGSVRVEAAGAGSTSSVTITSVQGPVTINGSATVIASALQASATLDVAGNASASGATAIKTTGLRIAASGDGTVVATSLTGTQGTVQLTGAMNLSSSGTNATGTLSLTAGVGKLQADGAWSIMASGYQAQSTVTLTQLVNTIANVEFAQNIAMTSTGYGSGVSLLLNQQTGAGGNISIAGISLTQSSGMAAGASGSQLTLLTSKGNFSASSALNFVASGENSSITYRIGSGSALNASAAGDVILHGKLEQTAKGVNSRVSGTISAVSQVTSDAGIDVVASGTGNSSDLNFDGKAALFLGKPSFGNFSSLTVFSAGYGSTASANAHNIDGAITLYQSLTLSQQSGFTSFQAASNTTKIDFSGGKIRDFTLNSDLELSAESHAVNATALINIATSAGALSIVKLPDPANFHEGQVSVTSFGFNSLAKFVADVNTDVASSSMAGFNVDGSMTVASYRSGDLLQPGYGAQASVRVAGKNATLHIGGDLFVNASDEFSRANILFTLEPAVQSSFISAIDGKVHVLAERVGSTATIKISGEAPVVIKGNLDVEAKYPGSFASFDGSHIVEIGGNVSIVAGDPSLITRAYAYASIRQIDHLGPGIWMLAAGQLSDIAVLDIDLTKYGGIIQIGTTDIGSGGKTFLQFDQATSAFVKNNGSGEMTIVMAMPDNDKTDSVLKSSILNVQGFRLGTDHLYFNGSASLLKYSNLDFRSFPGTNDEKLDQLLVLARATFQGRPQDIAGYFTADIGDDKYVVYDLDASGLTGLLRFEGMAGTDLRSQLVTTQAIPVFDAAFIRDFQNRVLTTGSIVKPSGDISTGNVNVTANFGATRNVSYITPNGLIATGAISVSALEYQTVASMEMQARQFFSDPVQVISTGDMTLQGVGLKSQASLNLQGLKGDVSIGGKFQLSSFGDYAQSFAFIKLSEGKFTMANSVDVIATGYRTSSKLTLLDFDDFSTNINFLVSGSLSARSSGFHANAIIESETARFDVSGSVSSIADGAESLASISLGSYLSGANIGGDVSAISSADLAVAELSMGQSSGSNGVQTYVINGKLASIATGTQSRATSTIDLTGGGARSSVNVGSALSVESSGDKSSALIRIAAVNGDINAQGAGVNASGAQSSATLTLATGLARFTSDGTGSPAANGAGNIIMNGVLTVRAEAMPVQDSASVNALATVVACAGNISIGGLGVSAIDGRASVLVQAGSVGTDGILVPGSFNVNGAPVFEAAGAYSTVAARLYSFQGAMTLGGNLTVIASGSNSSNRLNAESSWVENAAPASPQVLMSLNANVQVLASGNASLASATFRETGRNLRFNGDVNVIASADNSQGESHIYGAGTTVFVSAVTVTGSLGVSASGAASKASLSLAGENFESDKNAILSGAAGVTVTGPVSVFSAGANAVADLSISNRNGNDLPAAVYVNSAVSVKAAGTGSTSSLSVSAAGSGVTGVSRPLAIAGALDMEASGADSHAKATLDGFGNAMSVASISLAATGSNSELTLLAMTAGKLELASGGLQAVSSGDGATTHITLSGGSAGLNLNGDLNLVGSGDNSLLEASLGAANGTLLFNKDIQLHSIGEGSDVRLSLLQASSAAVSVTGVMNLSADSGVGSAIGAKASGDFTLGKLGASAIDLYLNSVQDNDSASLSLKLFTGGGVAQLGGANQHGTATLTLGDKTATANQLPDEVDISFSGSSGKAILHFGADRDSTTATSIQQVLIKGFRLGVDELNFDGLAKLATTGITMDSFIGGAIGHFNTSTSTTTTPAPVADVLVGGNANATYIAYDHDGIGISAIIVLDGVSASAYKTANGLG